MQEYSLTEENIIKKKKFHAIFLAIEYLIFVGLVAYKLLLNDPDTTVKLVLGVICLAFIAGYVFNYKRYNNQITNLKLTIDDKCATTLMPKRPNHSINFNDIKEIKVKKQGISLVNKESSKRSLFIGNKFEQFNEIEQTIRDRMNHQL
jgi:hypothetical protein